MKSPFLLFFAALQVLWFGAGCEHVDTTPEGGKNRVIHGTLNAGVALPAGAEIMVRIVAPAGVAARPQLGGDIPVARQTGASAERILGEQVQTLKAPVAEAVPYKIECDIEDAVLRRGVNLEARIYYNGRVRFRTVNAQVVTLSAVPFPQNLTLQGVER